MALSLDGNISYIGTEFIKLLNTGSSHLATEEYVDNAIAEGGGGNVDLSNYYTQTETDNLLNNKLNVNNPQDIIGTIRIDSTNGNGKLIVNAVGAPNDEDFYVNGLSNLGGTLKCQLLQASSNIETSQQIQSDTYNTNTNSNMVIQRNSIDYIVLESDKVNFKKDIYLNDVLFTGSGNPFDENVVINNPYELQCNTFNNSVLNQDMVFNINGGEWFRLQFSDNTVRVPNTKSFLSQNIFTDVIKPLTFSNDVVLNGGNSTNDAYEEYLRLDASTEKISVSKNIDTIENIYMNLNKRLYLNDTVGSERYIVSTFRSGTPSFNQLDIVNNNSSNGRIRLMINTEENVIIENSQLYSKRVITAVAGVKGNVYNSNGDNDVVFQRDDNEFFKLDKFTEDTIEKEAIICSKQLRANANILVRNLQINQVSIGIEYTDFRLHNTDSVMRFYVGNSTGVNLQITNDDIYLNRATSISSVKTNLINSNGDNDVVFQRNGTTFLTLDDTDGVKASQSITVEGAGDYVYTNNIRHNTGTNLNIWTLDTMKFYSNASNKMEIKQTQIDINEDVVFASGKGLTVPEIFTYNYDTTGTAGDVIWQYNNTPYMYYDQSENQFAFLVEVISNDDFNGTAFNVVSDERMKENIEDVDEDCSEIVKNIEVKTFNYKDDKKKKKNIGYIAQDVKKKVPSKFEAVVSDSGEFMGLDYGKMSAILWKALQEEMAKTEYLESKLFETIARVEALEKTKPKPKAKAKSEK